MTRAARVSSRGNAEMTARFLHKTRLCIYYSKGYCARGEDCNFAHGSGDVRTAPDFSYTQQCRSLVKTGRCRQGDACKFAHAAGQLRPWEGSEEGEEYNESGSQYGSQCGSQEYHTAHRAAPYELPQPQCQTPWAQDDRSAAALAAPLPRGASSAHPGQDSSPPLTATVKRTFLHVFAVDEDDTFDDFRRCSSAPPRARTH
ncbi:unnamed protein product [Prorocentrum cordatum]|uniref:C3H1-type domain-containing protein n=1 Tax=Prorocentrum cordatum TaxID=2364126 RepID=A0ABN9T0T0_9DINO|nr:unnamed protein product [Polarella glacialis]